MPTITGVAASTHPMDVYGGFQLSAEEVEAIAVGLREGTVKIGVRHDPRLTLDASVIDAHAAIDAGGHTLAIVTIQVDEDEWNSHDGDTLGGFSVSVMRRFLGNPTDAPTVTITADAHWFSDEQVAAAYEVFTSRNIPAAAYHLYQFADVPTILVILTFITQQLSSIPAGLLCNYIYDSLKNFIGRDEPSRITMKFDSETGRITEAHIATSSESVLRDAIDKLPEIIRSNTGMPYEFSDDENSWKQIDS